MNAVSNAERVPTLGLPPRAYTDPEWLAREQELLFARSWTLVAQVDEIARPGATLSTTVGRRSMLIVRDEQSALRAFVDPGSGSSEPVPGAVATWEGMVFANADASAPALEAALGELPDHIGSYRPGRLTEVARCRIEGDFNWKLFVENHIDVYHLWYLHETSLAGFDHTQFQHQRLGSNWVSYEPAKQSVQRYASLDQGTVAIRHLDDRDRNGLGAHMVFPNILLATASEFFATYAVYPISPSRSWIDLRIRAEADADADALVRATRTFISEDVVACERVQDALRSDRFAVGALAREHERSISDFHHDLFAVLGDPG
jgi:Rieske 2Fe-2S family protein